MTPEQRAERRAFLSMERWARKEANASRDARDSAKSEHDKAVWYGRFCSEMALARECERRARRIK